MSMQHLYKLIERFLQEPRDCMAGDGFAEVTNEDMRLLDELLYILLRWKFSKDANDSLPIQVELINLHSYEHSSFEPVPRRNLDNDQEIMRVLAMNLQLANERIQAEIRNVSDKLDN